MLLLSPVLLLVAAYVWHLLRCPFVVIFVEESGMYFSWRLHHLGYFIYVSALVDTICSNNMWCILYGFAHFYLTFVCSFICASIHSRFLEISREGFCWWACVIVWHEFLDCFWLSLIDGAWSDISKDLFMLHAILTSMRHSERSWYSSVDKLNYRSLEIAWHFGHDILGKSSFLMKAVWGTLGRGLW